MADIIVQFVRADGTCDIEGVRCRIAPGNGFGSLADEFRRGVATPVLEPHEDELLRGVSDPALRRFAARLPVARLEDAPPAEPEADA